MTRRPRRFPPFPTTPLSRPGVVAAPGRVKVVAEPRLAVLFLRELQEPQGAEPHRLGIGRSRQRPEGLEILVDEAGKGRRRSEEHTSELQSQSNLVCRLLLEK